MHGGHLTNLITKLEYAYSLLSYELYQLSLDTAENAYAATAHAPNHVTGGYGVKNNYLFGIPDTDLSVYCATSVTLA